MNTCMSHARDMQCGILHACMDHILMNSLLALMGLGGAEGPWGVTPGGAGGGGGGTQYVKLLAWVALVPIRRPT